MLDPVQCPKPKSSFFMLIYLTGVHLSPLIITVSHCITASQVRREGASLNNNILILIMMGINLTPRLLRYVCKVQWVYQGGYTSICILLGNIHVNLLHIPIILIFSFSKIRAGTLDLLVSFIYLSHSHQSSLLLWSDLLLMSLSREPIIQL